MVSSILAHRLLTASVFRSVRATSSARLASTCARGQR